MTVEEKINAIIDKYLPKIEFWVKYVNWCMLEVTFHYMRKFAGEIKNEGN